MAGSDPTGATDIDEVRSNLRDTMLLGLPNDPALRPIFHFPRIETFSPEDNGGQPLDWTQDPVTDTNDNPGEPRVVTCGSGTGQIVCTWEAGGGRGGTQSNETPFGDFDVERLVITILDVDRAKIDGFNKVVIGTQTFLPDFELPPVGLYEMTVHQIVVQNRDAHVVHA